MTATSRPPTVSKPLLMRSIESRALRGRLFRAANVIFVYTRWRNLVGQIYLGSDEWVDEMREKVALKPRDAEHPSVQRRLDRWTMNDVLTCVGAGLRIPPMLIRNSRGGTARMLAAWLGAHHALLPLATIGASLRIRSVGHVSELVKSCDGQLTSDDVLRDDLQRCRALFHVL